MELFVNELSLHGQYEGPQDFRAALRELLECQSCVQSFARRLYVPRRIVQCDVTREYKLREAVQRIGNQGITRAVMLWLDRTGPFADDVLTRNPNEWYELDGNVITETAIGEVAARIFTQEQAALVSFAPSNFARTPLSIIWCRSDTDKETCEIDNHWRRDTLTDHLERCQSAPTTWQELLEQLPPRFPHLTFASNLLEHLTSEPYSAAIADRVFVLLGVLNELKQCFDDQGRRTARGEDLMDNYFRRKEARFTDASEPEKKDAVFRRAMTFHTADGEQIECFWHGKIATRYFRIHFSYPIEKNIPLYIAYIGPKLTKQ
jgi:hypothetical protein